MRSLKKVLFSLVVLSMLSHCSQSRRGNVEKSSEVWAAQEICASDDQGAPVRCISIEPNITENYATVTITRLDFDPSREPYRLLARAAGQSTWHFLAGDLTLPAGASFEIDPKNGVFIEEYEEYLLEAINGTSSDGLNVASEEAGMGVPLIWGYVDYPELLLEADDNF